MNNESQVFVGIDIGTSFIKIIAIQAANNSMNVVGVGVAESKGVNKGMIVDIDQTIADIKAAQADLNKKSQIPMDQVTVGIPTGHLTIEELKGSIKLGDNPREITEEDLRNLVTQILGKHQVLDRDFVGFSSEEFIVDNFDGIHDPFGMMGMSLSIKCLAYSIPKTIFQNIIKAIKGAGFTVRNVVLNPVAIAAVALSGAQREMGTVLIDAGSGETSVNVFQNGCLQISDTIFEGGKNVTSDISKVLQISNQDAETVKIDYGSLRSQNIPAGESFVIKSLDRVKEIEISDQYLSEIIGARFEQIFDKVKQILVSSSAFNLPGGIIITGGNSALPGTKDQVSILLEKQVTIYVPDQIGVRNQIYTVVYGLIIHTLHISKVQKTLEETLNFNFHETTPSGKQTEQAIESEEDLTSEAEKKVKSKKNKKNNGIMSSLKKWIYNLFE